MEGMVQTDMEVVLEMTLGQIGLHHIEKCIKQPVQNVALNVKFLLNRPKENQFTVGRVSQNAGPEDFKQDDK